MLRKYRLRKELKQLCIQRDKLIHHLDNCAELSKFGHFTVLGMSQLKESELRLIDVHKRISEIEHILNLSQI